MTTVITHKILIIPVKEVCLHRVGYYSQMFFNDRKNNSILKNKKFCENDIQKVKIINFHE